jgi:hypothetical protein
MFIIYNILSSLNTLYKDIKKGKLNYKVQARGRTLKEVGYHKATRMLHLGLTGWLQKDASSAASFTFFHLQLLVSCCLHDPVGN